MINIWIRPFIYAIVQTHLPSLAYIYIYIWMSIFKKKKYGSFWTTKLAKRDSWENLNGSPYSYRQPYRRKPLPNQIAPVYQLSLPPQAYLPILYVLILPRTTGRITLHQITIYRILNIVRTKTIVGIPHIDCHFSVSALT